jgi:TPR repeat protein
MAAGRKTALSGLTLKLYKPLRRDLSANFYREPVASRVCFSLKLQAQAQKTIKGIAPCGDRGYRSGQPARPASLEKGTKTQGVPSMPILSRFFTAVLFLLLWAVCALAAQDVYNPDEKTKTALQQASEAYKAKDYDKTRKILKPLTDRNDPMATFVMGLMAARGAGQKQDFRSAENWWKKSSDAGNPLSQFHLGLLYFQGALGSPDFVRARSLWTKAAAAKSPEAMYGLGLLQKNGQGGSKDPAGAVRNFEAASALGHPLAAYELGQAYQNGQGGVKKDLKKAKELFAQAASRGVSEARAALDALNAAGM